MFVVTGGKDRTYNSIDSTETFDPIVESWAISGAKLPQKIWGLKAANVNGHMMIFGKPKTEFSIRAEAEP